MRASQLSRVGLGVAVLHLLLLANTVRLILGTPGPAWTQHWVIFLALDFPMSLGVMPVSWLVPPSAQGPLQDMTNFWWPLCYHALIGTLWWYIVGSYIQRRMTAARRTPPRD